MHITVGLLALTMLGPSYLEDQFEMPEGFRIYRVASGELCGGSYDIAFDGSGRLLVGDGTQVRRLIDDDADGVYDRYEVIASGLGGRGPQGLAVVGDRLFAVGGDGVQLYEGYERPEANPGGSGTLTHVGRVGAPFQTGGDHAAHQIFRGHDDYLYFITGDGGGTRDRAHITEDSSPALRERACSVFRISPDGERWECIGTGGRNAPNLGMNYLGDLFSLDSDMEWHVDTPWWRPVRLNHWTAGGDHGWQGVGAYPSYFIDCQGGIYDVGRGSPDWGIFYEHDQFPERYRDAYLVCDYRSKSATTGGYNTTGRLFAFFLAKQGPSWTADMEVFAMPKAGARDGSGQRIDFALVDIDIGLDGSVYLSDKGQGVWRIFYDPTGELSAKGPPPIAPGRLQPVRQDPGAYVDDLLALPQPSSEAGRLERERVRRALGEEYVPRLLSIAGDAKADLRRRLRALRYLAPGFAELPESFPRRLAGDEAAEMRGQAAWLMGLRGRPAEAELVVSALLNDRDPFVRRRALESLARNRPRKDRLTAIVDRFEDPERLVRYVAMIALSHHPTSDWFEDAAGRPGKQTRLRALVTADLRGDLPPPAEIRRVVGGLLEDVTTSSSKEDRLDLLRILGKFRDVVSEDETTRQRAVRHVLEPFPDRDEDIVWEQARLIGEYRIEPAFGALASRLETESRPVMQFHLAQMLARLPAGWNAEEETRAVRWFLRTQRGWFVEAGGKGLQFPQFWATVLSDFARHHAGALRAVIDEIDLASPLGSVVLDRLAEETVGAQLLIELYRSATTDRDRVRLARAIGRIEREDVSAFLREEYDFARAEELQAAILKGLARQPPYGNNRVYLEDGLLSKDPEVVRSSAMALTRFRPETTQDVLQTVITRMVERRDVFRACERLLVAMSGKQRPGYSSREERRRAPRDEEREAALKFWKAWYRERFEEEFRPLGEEAIEEKTNDELRRFLLAGPVRGGNVERGEKSYEALCVKCHGGMNKGEKLAAIFGPDLAGVTRRLSREEFADALVEPSKMVPDRYRAIVVQRADGEVFTGFVTEETEKELTLATQDRIERIPREKIALTASQETSLMPDGLLNRLEWDEIRDLVAFLEELGARPEKKEEEKEKDAGK